MNFYLIAGEYSGDFIGSKLMMSIMDNSQEELKFNGIGGTLMAKAGLKSLFPIQEINLMGFLEILPHIFRIKKLIDKTVDDIIAKNPKVVITIDSPGFTYRVAKEVKKIAPHIKLIHIVAPSVWAYKPSRAKKYAKVYDKLLTMLPFEPDYFIKEGLSSEFVGYFALEQHFYRGSIKLRKELNISDDVKVIAITPGSRPGEILRHMPIIRESLDRITLTHNIKVIFIQPNDTNIQLISKFLSGAKFNYIFSTDRLKAFAVSHCALAKSGTNTLEISASNTPMIIGYKLNPISFLLLRMMIKVKFASIVNIIAGREVIPEYIQSDFTVNNIVLALSELISNSKKTSSQLQQVTKILNSIGLNWQETPSQKAAKIIINYLKQ